MSLSGALSRIQYHAALCNGVKSAPVKLPESLNVYPFAVAYPEIGELNSESYDAIRALHTIICEFHVARTLLGYAIDTAMPLLEEMHRRLKVDETLNSEVENIVWPITYQFGRLEWDGTPTIGFRLHIPVKIRGVAST